MSRYYTDERIDVPAGTTVTLTASKFENANGSRAGEALIENSAAANSEVLYRFGTTGPTASPVAGHRLDPGESVRIVGYDNLKALQIRAVGSAAASIFVSYAT